MLKRTTSITYVALICLMMTAGSLHARTHDAPRLLNISDSEYQLALTQVLSEICPSMLTLKQQNQFNTAYHNQIRLFMPNVSSPKEAMQQLAHKQDYQIALKNMRTWTASFPPSENKALCQEFAQSSTIF